ncbi:MAG TPA: hypothetical protein VFJ97_14010 [Dermatophilaceae bacterium]|nr:hypothetical protein [Dermatophilaceae bacterium]
MEQSKTLQEAYVTFLASHRQFRRFLITERMAVELVSVEGEEVAVIDGATERWEALDNTYARVQLLVGETVVDDAARALGLAVRQIAAARGRHGPGQVPGDVLRACWAAENAFADAARADLERRVSRR